MSKFFVVLADDFEAKIVVKILERNNKKFTTIGEEERISDQVDKKIKKPLKIKTN